MIEIFGIGPTELLVIAVVVALFVRNTKAEQTEVVEPAAH